jgi:hypothetical protein
MGGWGSGSARRSWIATTDTALRLDICMLSGTRSGQLFTEVLSRDAPPMVEIEINALDDGRYRFRPWIGTRTRYGWDPGEIRRLDWLSETSLFVAIAASRANYGGIRLWFVCPRSGCGRRCGVLYREPDTNARAFVCVRCARLAYSSQRQSRTARLEVRANRIAARLVLKPGTSNVYVKPKWMRWLTFARLVDELDQLDSLWQPIRNCQAGRFQKEYDILHKRALREFRKHERALARTKS